jgi:hypothetical protein
MTLDAQFARYRSAGVLVDTNLLLLYFIGANDPSDISRFKRTMQFRAEDYRLLVRVLGAFRRIVTTPHIVTEVSNLAGQLTGRTRDGFFARLAAGLSSMDEEHTEATTLARADTFVRFGITDTALFHQARGRYLVLTDDFRLSQYLVSQRVDAVNFNHLRQHTIKWPDRCAAGVTCAAALCVVKCIRCESRRTAGAPCAAGRLVERGSPSRLYRLRAVGPLRRPKEGAPWHFSTR